MFSQMLILLHMHNISSHSVSVPLSNLLGCDVLLLDEHYGINMYVGERFHNFNGLYFVKREKAFEW